MGRDSLFGETKNKTERFRSHFASEWHFGNFEFQLLPMRRMHFKFCGIFGARPILWTSLTSIHFTAAQHMECMCLCISAYGRMKIFHIRRLTAPGRRFTLRFALTCFAYVCYGSAAALFLFRHWFLVAFLFIFVCDAIFSSGTSASPYKFEQKNKKHTKTKQQ